jgi:hypothetical protein
MKNIHAYTGIAYKVYPAFISINKDKVDFKISIRSIEDTGHAEIVMTAEQLIEMAESILKELA